MDFLSRTQNKNHMKKSYDILVGEKLTTKKSKKMFLFEEYEFKGLNIAKCSAFR